MLTLYNDQNLKTNTDTIAFTELEALFRYHEFSPKHPFLFQDPSQDSAQPFVAIVLLQSVIVPETLLVFHDFETF